MGSIRTALTKAAGLAAATSFALAATAQAAPVTFTFDPTAVPLTGSTPVTADKIFITDYARVTLGASAGTNTAFTETGYLAVNNYSLAGTTFNPTGNRTSYTLYIAFSATGSQTSASFSTSSVGTFNSLNYTLYGVNGASSFSVAGPTPTVTNAGTPVELANGTLIQGSTSFLVNGPGSVTPNASVVETVTKDLTAFFAAPPNVVLDLDGAFTSDPGLVTLVGTSAFTINGGGGDITFTAVVPEPTSLALLGSAFLGFGFLRRRS